MQLNLYYFTGTGNALQATRWTEVLARNFGYQVSVTSVSKGSEMANEAPDLIGFFYPTHGFAPAPTMLQWIWHFPRAKTKSSFFLVNTRAGVLFFGIHFPGLSGLALLLPALILIFKGYRFRGALPLDMPSNWISIHPPLAAQKVERIVKNCSERMNDFAAKLLSGNSNRWRMLRDLPADLLISPVSFAYYFFGRFFLAKTFVHTDRCNTCGNCIRQCPAGAIEERTGYPFWTVHCESCMRCLNICPTRSIQSSHLLFFLGMSIMFLSPLYYLLHGMLPARLLNLADALLPLPFLVGFYFLVWPAFRTRAGGFLFRRTSLTSYWGRYLAPGVRKRDLKVKTVKKKLED